MIFITPSSAVATFPKPQVFLTCSRARPDYSYVVDLSGKFWQGLKIDLDTIQGNRHSGVPASPHLSLSVLISCWSLISKRQRLLNLTLDMSHLYNFKFKFWTSLILLTNSLQNSLNLYLFPLWHRNSPTLLWIAEGFLALGSHHLVYLE